MSPSTLPSTMNAMEIPNGNLKLKPKSGLQSAGEATNYSQATGADHLSKLFCDSAVLKIWKTAVDHLLREVRIRLYWASETILHAN